LYSIEPAIRQKHISWCSGLINLLLWIHLANLALHLALCGLSSFLVLALFYHPTYPKDHPNYDQNCTGTRDEKANQHSHRACSRTSSISFDGKGNVPPQSR
jgi:hypothetical protein